MAGPYLNGGGGKEGSVTVPIFLKQAKEFVLPGAFLLVLLLGCVCLGGGGGG